MTRAGYHPLTDETGAGLLDSLAAVHRAIDVRRAVTGFDSEPGPEKDRESDAE